MGVDRAAGHAAGRGRRGRPPAHPMRAIVAAILYVTCTGCPWRALPREFPPPGTVYWWFARWRDDHTLMRLHDRLREQCRTAAGRHRHPTAGAIDSQSVRAADTVPRRSRGFDVAKKVNGRKRHIVVDTMGLLLAVMVTGAHVNDRSIARDLLWRTRLFHPGLRLIWADGGYIGTLSTWARHASTSPCTWSANSPDNTPSSCCPAAGSSNAPSPGSARNAAASATTNTYPPATPPSSPGP
ncbi:IS5 family transposase [Micromonospora sp. BRA006-A]|nr:IS5 family transposase [Micromonospora sp. BRA006-A]